MVIELWKRVTNEKLPSKLEEYCQGHTTHAKFLPNVPEYLYGDYSHEGSGAFSSCSDTASIDSEGSDKSDDGSEGP